MNERKMEVKERLEYIHLIKMIESHENKATKIGVKNKSDFKPVCVKTQIKNEKE